MEPAGSLPSSLPKRPPLDPIWVRIIQSTSSHPTFKIHFNITLPSTPRKSRDSLVRIALGYGRDNRDSRVRFPAGAGNFSLHHRVQNGAGAHPASHSMGIRSSFPGGKAARPWSWPLTSISCRGQIMRGAILPLPQHAFMAWWSVKKIAQGQLYLYLFYFYIYT
jgi:hypothetical protein